MEFLVFKEIFKIFSLEFIEYLWICELFCFIRVSLDTNKSMLLKVIILSKPIIQFLGFIVTQQQFLCLKEGEPHSLPFDLELCGRVSV